MDNEWLVQPALAEPVESDSEALRLLTKEGWHAEQKLNGVRLMVHIHESKVIGINRKGAVTLIPPKVAEAFLWFDGEWVLDGELVKGIFWVFDLPRAMNVVDIRTPYTNRRDILEELWPRLEMPDCVRLLRSEREDEGSLSLALEVREASGEGLMLKDGTAPYTPGKRTRSTRKWKFYETADCIVLETWREGKQSMAVGLVDEKTGEIVDVGSVAMTPANLGKVERGDVVECKYLYVEDMSAPRLYQPAFVHKRDDKDMQECVLSQLKVTSRDVLS